MSLRILIFPISLVLTIFVLISMVIPEYRAMRVVQEEIAALDEEVTKLRAKSVAVDAMVRQLDTRKKELYAYLPQSSEEEVAIHIFSQLVSEYKLPVIDIKSTDEDNNSDVRTRMAIVEVDPNDPNAAAPKADVLRKQSADIAVKVVCPYDVCKMMLGRMHGLERSGFIQEATIELQSDPNADQNQLIMEAMLSSDYALIAKMRGDADALVVETLDFAPITSRKTAVFPDLTLPSADQKFNLFAF